MLVGPELEHLVARVHAHGYKLEPAAHRAAVPGVLVALGEGARVGDEVVVDDGAVGRVRSEGAVEVREDGLVRVRVRLRVRAMIRVRVSARARVRVSARVRVRVRVRVREDGLVDPPPVHALVGLQPLGAAEARLHASAVLEGVQRDSGPRLVVSSK